MILSQLEKLLEQQHWGKYSFDLQPAPIPQLIAAGTDDKVDWNIMIQFNEQVKDIDKLLANYGLGKLRRLLPRKKNNYFTGRPNLDNLLHFVVGHEVGHWRYCPGDINDREEIFTGIAEGLQTVGFRREEIEQHSQRIYNFFADVIDNVMNMYRDEQNAGPNGERKFTEGFLVFYAKEGLINDYTDDFFLFVDTIAKLAAPKKMKSFAASFTEKASELAPVTGKIMALFTEDAALVQKAEREELSLDEKVKVYGALGDKDKWHDKAKEFARIIGPYLRDQDKEQDGYQNNMPHLEEEGDGEGSPQPNQQKKKNGGKKGRKDKSPAPGGNKNSSGIGKGNQPVAGGLPGGNEELMREMVRKSLEKGRPLSSLWYAPKPIALDELYRQRAEKIVIAMQTQEGENSRFPLGYLSRRELDETRFNLNLIDWQNPEFGFNEQGREEIQFFERRVPLLSEHKGSETSGRVPDILFVVDISGSMMAGYDPESGVGPYDKLLRADYSVFKYLEDNDQIQHLKFAVVLFEGKPNYFSGWHTFYDLQQVKEAMLDPASYSRGLTGGTDLDEAVIQSAADTNPNPFWTILVSDGVIGNMGEACRAVSYLAERGKRISYIETREDLQQLAKRIEEQLPPSLRGRMSGISGYCSTLSSTFANHVRHVGGTVHPLQQPDDLPKIVLGKAKEIYDLS